ncbi:AMSH/STAMBP protein ubiquitin specific-protease [Purpureocillium takamizusanense]|uniref:AMSH/STAMBP protein ubiquitin specific-protease n=1 Tax=Purpureocillium takamizusanense TaxID=2060973 RepID=A0A9Q8Q6R1_9HYPO|nr:AMSH/STAMBP protein ubiquitin specific-protease [Purpureocillium takamizusanense]UNI13477.1 AMSH/STAMBP protein ubiquitin specific-protease [Purpureocillium takamizusanense]
MAALSHPLTTAADKPPPEAPREPQLSFPAANHHHKPHHQHHQHRRSSTPRSSISERPPNDHHLPAGTSQRPAHSSTPSSGSLSGKTQRPSSLLNRAAAAFDRTQIAIANLSEPVIRPRQSNSALARLSLASPVTNSEPASPERNPSLRAASTQSLASSVKVDARQLAHAASAKDPPSQPYSETDPGHPAPIKLPAPDNKMHQTSSRLLRMTDDDRPFTRDFKDLFATLIVSLLPLSAHRVRLSKVEYTFLSEDAINNLGSLKFSQSNRMPDPKDPSRIVTTTTTTTFSMAKDMARSICQRFVEARFIESADGKYQQVYNMKGSVWQLTPKGVTVLDRFCARNGIQQKQVTELAAMNSAQLVILERDQQSDKLLNDVGTIEVIFRRFVGADGRNIKSSVTAADSDSLHDYKDGLTGVKMAAERKINGKAYRDTFTGKATVDWLMDCSTIVDRRETLEVATLFVEYGLIEAVVPDRTFIAQNTGFNLFQPTKHAIYQLTQRGKDLINGNGSRGRASESEGGTGSQRNGITRDSNTQRLEKILNDAALRLLFRENLRETHCEENLSFYKDVAEFVRGCKAAIRQAQKTPTATSMDTIKEIMAQAYGIYNAFLAPGSPCELNIDHQLRNSLATRMTKAVGQDNTMIETLQEVTALFEDAQNAVFKLMASDSVPKFLRNAKYEQQLRTFDLELTGRAPERSQSRSNRK